MNAKIESIVIPASVGYVGDGAFMGCEKLTGVTVENAACEFGKMVFEGCGDDLALTGQMDSPAQTYAEENGVSFVALKMNDEVLYPAALAALQAGDCASAQKMFASLGDYKDSRDYYIYSTARVYQENGETDKAVALYSLVPDILDAEDRAASLSSGENASDGQGGGIVIGGMLGKKTIGKSGDEPKVTEAPEPTEAPEASSDGVVSFQEFIGDMPYEFDDNTKDEQQYSIYFNLDDFAQLDAYRQTFLDAGWTESVQDPDVNGWSYVFVVSPDGNASFYIAYVESENLVVFMYDTTVDYGFNPAEGL